MGIRLKTPFLHDPLSHASPIDNIILFSTWDSFKGLGCNLSTAIQNLNDTEKNSLSAVVDDDHIDNSLIQELLQAVLDRYTSTTSISNTQSKQLADIIVKILKSVPARIEIREGLFETILEHPLIPPGYVLVFKTETSLVVDNVLVDIRGLLNPIKEAISKFSTFRQLPWAIGVDI